MGQYSLIVTLITLSGVLPMPHPMNYLNNMYVKFINLK